MIITLTPNPSVDRTLLVEHIRFNEVLRTEPAELDWGGKGFNVSRALKLLNQDVLALAWVGGAAGKMLVDGLNNLGIQTDFIRVEEETRTNTMARELAGEWYIRLNEPGPHIPQDAIDALLQKAANLAKEGDIWVASGSLPQDVPDTFYADLISMVHAKGARVFFDAYDQALRLGVEAHPFLVKPEIAEAEAFAGFPIRNYSDAQRAVLSFLRHGAENVAMTIGGLGVLLATQKEMVLALPPKMKARNFVISGDAVMAGLVYGLAMKLSLTDSARWGAAFGAAVVQSERIHQTRREDVESMLARIDVRVINVM